jgi:GDSL-like Lipase/Acylhydrolase family
MTDIATRWIRTPIDQALLHGWVELERAHHGLLPHRLPAWARSQWIDQQLAMVEAQPSGVRICFRSAATAIELEALPTKRVYRGMPPRPDGVYDLLIGGKLARQGSIPTGDVWRIDPSAWAAGTNAVADIERGAPGRVSFADLPEGVKDIEIWLPHDETTQLVALYTDAAIEAAPPSGRPIWLHHGSSISHGSNAVHPTGIWPAIAARHAGVDLLNLGLGGSALLDFFVARTIRDQPADLISLKLGINIVNMDLMRLRAFGPSVHGFLDTIREGHAKTPLLIVSPILCPVHEDTPGPTVPDFSDGLLKFRAAGCSTEIASGKLTLNVIRDALCRIVQQRRNTDPNIHYLDGRSLYGEMDNERLPLPDGLHPDTATHRLIGDHFLKAAFGGGMPFGSRRDFSRLVARREQQAMPQADD